MEKSPIYKVDIMKRNYKLNHVVPKIKYTLPTYEDILDERLWNDAIPILKLFPRSFMVVDRLIVVHHKRFVYTVHDDLSSVVDQILKDISLLMTIDYMRMKKLSDKSELIDNSPWDHIKSDKHKILDLYNNNTPFTYWDPPILNR